MYKALDELTPSELAKLRAQVSKRVGKRLREVRKQKGFSQEAVAERAGLYRTYIGHVETGSRLPNVFTLWRIAKALDTDLNKLLEEV